MSIVFFGTSEFGAIVLQKMVQAGRAPVLVVTAPDTPAGRKQVLTPPPVKASAQKYDIPVFQSDSIPNTKYQILNTNPDLIVLAAYGRIIPGEILDIPGHGALNVHPSLLPKYRGASPIQTAILKNDRETGVSIILMDEEVDHGAIVANTKYQILNTKYTYQELHSKLAKLGGDLLVKTIPQWIAGTIVPKEQDHSKATYTKKLTKEDGRIDWKKPAEYIERQVRAFSPWPGTFALFGGKNLKILKTSVLPGNPPKPGLGQGPKPGLGRVTPGTVFLTADKKLAIQCGEDALLVEELQLEGGKPMNSREFLLGHKGFLGTILGRT